MKKILPLLVLFSFTLGFYGCDKGKAATTPERYANLNVTILLDLSDRISKTKNPEQTLRDTAAVMQIVRSFKKFVRSKGIAHTEDKIKVIFYPQGSQSLIHRTAAELSVDFSAMEGSDKRYAYETHDSIYSNGLSRIYDAASSASSFDGSDIFSFFRYRAADDCIEGGKDTKNILVILSDGYLYHRDNKIKEGNRYSYIGPQAPHLTMFRGKENWEKSFDEGGYGLIATGVTLENLSVLVLEVNPAAGHVRDYEIIHKYWGSWFEEMGISNQKYKIVQSDLPSQNAPIIGRFIEAAARL